MAVTEELKRAALAQLGLAVKATERGDINWDRLQQAIQTAIDAGCANADDLSAVKGKTYSGERWEKIAACLGKNIPEGLRTRM